MSRAQTATKHQELCSVSPYSRSIRSTVDLVHFILGYYCKCWVQANNALGRSGRTEHTAATHPTDAASSEGNADTSNFQACRSIYGHYGYQVGGAPLTQPVPALSQGINTAQLLWSMLAHSVAAWEMQHRPGGVCMGEGTYSRSVSAACNVCASLMHGYICQCHLQLLLLVLLLQYMQVLYMLIIHVL